MKNIKVDQREFDTIILALRKWATLLDDPLVPDALADRLEFGKRAGRRGTKTFCGKCGVLCDSLALSKKHCMVAKAVAE